jgi:hypothetical protein
MELGPWAPCIDWLATAPEEAASLLADAVAILQDRAAHLAATGRRVWEPATQMPALVIIIDEYAELADEAPDAMSDTDSIAPPRPRRTALAMGPLARLWRRGLRSRWSVLTMLMVIIRSGWLPAGAAAGPEASGAAGDGRLRVRAAEEFAGGQHGCRLGRRHW